MTKKATLLSMALMLAAILATAQNNTFHSVYSGVPKTHRELNERAEKVEIPSWGQQELPVLKKQKAGEDWWEPDTVCFFAEENYRYIYAYSQQGLITMELSQIEENGEWVNYRRTTLAYTENNSPLSQLTEAWENNGWVSSSKITATYDGNNNVLILSFEAWEDGKPVDGTPWSGTRKYTYTYDGQNNTLSQLEEYWEDTQYRNAYKDTYTYDGRNNRLTELSERWDNNEWGNNVRYTYTYDGNNNMLTDLSEDWENNEWVSYTKYTFTYDGRNNLLTELNEDWEDNEWVNYSKYTWTYDDYNKMLTESDEGWYNGGWRKYNKEVWTYDENNNLRTHLYQNGKDDEWVNTSRFTTVCNADNVRLSDLQEYWENNNDWVGSTRSDYTYDENMNLTIAFHEKWVWQQDSGSYGWGNDYKFNLTYDENNNCILNEFWDWEEGEWHSSALYPNGNMELFYNNMQSILAYGGGYKLTADYAKVTKPASIENIEAGGILIYPNPTTGQLTIENGELKINNIDVFDMMGKKLSTFNFQFSTIDISHLPTGVYFLRMQTEAGAVTRKIIKN